MNPNILEQLEDARGCGYRTTPGALYLCSDGEPQTCGRLPIPLHVCPTCGQGIKPARGWTWINLLELCLTHPCASAVAHCFSCPLGDPPARAGLIWIGERFYPSPGSFLSEARRMGISRRITSVPRGFRLGEDVVALAHRKVSIQAKTTPAIFSVFKPARIEVICNGMEDTETIDRYLERGFTPVLPL